jgi:hypothetical protein
VRESLRRARSVALVVEDKQAQPLAAAIRFVQESLAAQGKKLERVRAEDYLADRTKYGWVQYRPVASSEVKSPPTRYDLIATFDAPGLANGLVPPDLCRIALTDTDPGAGRGLVQYVVMPVYDTEDAISLAGGDADGVLAAARELASPSAVVTPAEARGAFASLTAYGTTAPTRKLPGLREFVRVPIGELAATPDGQRNAVGLRGWGNNLIILAADGSIVAKEACGKLFPAGLEPLNDGFTIVTHENDPKTLSLRIYGRDGRVKGRIAAPARRVGGVRDWSPSLPHPDVMIPFLRQASFSVSPDGRLAAGGGSKAIAMWDVSAGKLLWRDDAMHYTAPDPQNVTSGPLQLAASFPQVRLSPDGAWLAVMHRETTEVRDDRTGNRLAAPTATGAPGLISSFNGHVYVVGNPDVPWPPFSGFAAWREGRAIWRWRASQELTATAFSVDGARFAIGEVDGTLRLMEGGGQRAGWQAPDGALRGLRLSSDAQRAAFATTGGWADVIDFDGRIFWLRDFGVLVVIHVLGKDGDSLVGDHRGILRPLRPTGEVRWMVDLTPFVWRSDVNTVLTSLDTIPTLRLPAPDRPRVAPPAAVTNLARTASVQLLRPNAWMGGDGSAVREVSLNDGQRVAPAGGRFTPSTLEFAAFVPSPPAWQLEWKEPLTLNTFAIHESPDHPEAVPEDIAIDVWQEGSWKRVTHEHWNRDVVHAHRFDSVTTTKIRYVPMGDLTKNVWLSEIEVYEAAP